MAGAHKAAIHVIQAIPNDALKSTCIQYLAFLNIGRTP